MAEKTFFPEKSYFFFVNSLDIMWIIWKNYQNSICCAFLKNFAHKLSNLSKFPFLGIYLAYKFPKDPKLMEWYFGDSNNFKQSHLAILCQFSTDLAFTSYIIGKIYVRHNAAKCTLSIFTTEYRKLFVFLFFCYFLTKLSFLRFWVTMLSILVANRWMSWQNLFFWAQYSPSIR